ncbi:MAG: hypothetical protein F6K23_19510 [Okeania sp. SIO2C9]|uniref:hypothetical protein n=1 Tax=Okeania sp. SIO2C9 TaxID=2607791 RepID=UPI0013C13898|nr:hypothetical protein [Okeania sp. SIO2C9]NEQ75032.1 hypothetical protein [Okeania sp. SIO2C9]
MGSGGMGSVGRWENGTQLTLHGLKSRGFFRGAFYRVKTTIFTLLVYEVCR